MIIHLASLPTGDHIVTQVQVGTSPADMRVAGQLSLNLSEWQLFGTALLLGADALSNGFLQVTNDGDEAVVLHFHKREGRPHDQPNPHP